jgi:hypothetical protein
VSTLTACGDRTAANADNFSRGMKTYLAQHGALCVGKRRWPIDVSARDVALRARDALQMPVLERLGLVRSSPAVATVSTEDGQAQVDVTRYDLTDAGRRYYLTNGVAGKDPHAGAGDLCMATLELDRVVSWEVAKDEHGRATSAVVSYTYDADAPDWVRGPEVEQVFPAVARVVEGAGRVQLREGFTATPEGWVANELVDRSALVAQSKP